MYESASNIDPTLIRVQAFEVSVKFLNFFGHHLRPIVPPIGELPDNPVLATCARPACTDERRRTDRAILNLLTFAILKGS
jgi:hypothetical protein